MKYFKVLLGVLLVISVLGALTFLTRHDISRMRAGLPPFTSGAGDSLEVMVAMADGVRLRTAIDLPDGPGPYPTILIRNPYATFGTYLRDILCGRFVRYGYACVIQDTRGQGGSEGEWSPLVNELNDGRDTLNWLVEQSFQDGNIGLVGPSYLAGVQYAAAAAGLPAQVKTMVPAVFTTDNRDVLYSDGMFRHETFTAWASMMRDSNHAGDGTGADYQEALHHLPHNTVDSDVFGLAMPWYQEMIDVERAYSSFNNSPANQALYAVPEQLRIPVLMIGGWYDVFFGPQFNDWQRLATQSRSRFVIGPWTHVGSTGDAFDIQNAEGGLFQWHEMLPWLEHHLKGKPLKHGPGISLYTMGSNNWSEHAVWPGETQRRTLHLANISAAGDCTGGELASEPGSGLIRYQYDPMNPVPTKGGSGMLAFVLPSFDGAPPANVSQVGLCERQDVISFSTDRLDESWHISGSIDVELQVSSTAPDTAFTAKLVEVFADGRMINIRDGITSLAYDRGEPVQSPYEPGSRTRTTVRLWPIDWRTSPGSRLRLDISSSDFPKFHFHRNRAGPWAEQDGADIAMQTLYGGMLTLPLSAGINKKGLE